MAKRRGNNEGTLYQRKDGLWCAQVSLNGRRLTKYAKQRSECYLWIRETLGRIHAGLSLDGIQMTLASYVETWLKGKELSRRPRQWSSMLNSRGNTFCLCSDISA